MLMPKIDMLSAISKLSLRCEKLFWNFWWMSLVVILCLIVTEQAMKAVKSDYDQLYQQHLLLLQEKEKALALRNTLKLQINSQSDPAWVELTLKKGLGLVPEGQIKVLFTD